MLRYSIILFSFQTKYIPDSMKSDFDRAVEELERMRVVHSDEENFDEHESDDDFQIFSRKRKQKW